jgi:predicted aspartyl protease
MNVLTFDYDTSYAPPAPVIEIEIDGYNRLFGKAALRAMVDSGADASLIPLEVLDAVGATYKETAWMRSVAGDRSRVDLYLVGVEIRPHLIRGLHVVAAPNNTEAIIGRDVLNQLVLTLDGPGEVVTIETNL